MILGSDSISLAVLKQQTCRQDAGATYVIFSCF
jgi:hypothetical protein